MRDYSRKLRRRFHVKYVDLFVWLLWSWSAFFFPFLRFASLLLSPFSSFFLSWFIVSCLLPLILPASLSSFFMPPLFPLVPSSILYTSFSSYWPTSPLLSALLLSFHSSPAWVFCFFYISPSSYRISLLLLTHLSSLMLSLFAVHPSLISSLPHSAHGIHHPHHPSIKNPSTQFHHCSYSSAIKVLARLKMNVRALIK